MIALRLCCSTYTGQITVLYNSMVCMYMCKVKIFTQKMEPMLYKVEHGLSGYSIYWLHLKEILCVIQRTAIPYILQIYCCLAIYAMLFLFLHVPVYSVRRAIWPFILFAVNYFGKICHVCRTFSVLISVKVWEVSCNYFLLLPQLPNVKLCHRPSFVFVWSGWCNRPNILTWGGVDKC